MPTTKRKIMGYRGFTIELEKSSDYKYWTFRLYGPHCNRWDTGGYTTKRKATKIAKRLADRYHQLAGGGVRWASYAR